MTLTFEKIKNKIYFLLERKIFIYFYYGKSTFLPNNKAQDDKYHLDQSMCWLKNAQDASSCGGVSYAYLLLKRKWGQPYRETTGYIIPTFINYGLLQHKKEFIERAVKMGDWEIENQTDEGGIGEPRNDGPTRLKVFNTGQVMLGWCSLYDQTNNKKYLQATIKSAGWILNNQEPRGSWDKFSNDGPKTIDSRIAWALMEVYQRTRKEEYKIAAEKHINWVMDQQKENGWFNNCSLRDHEKPWTHTIAYTISGLLESYMILKDDKILKSALMPSEKILEYYKNSGYNYLPGTFDKNWESKDRYSCLTGNAQMATVWIKLHKITGDKKFLDGAEKTIEQLKKLQIIKTSNININGGIAGSYPISGEYATYKLPNWAAKFFADALMLKENPDLPLLS